MENLNRYYQEVRNKEKKLSKQEELELIAKAQTGCTASRDIVIAANARFVLKCAKERLMPGSLQDLIQAGNIGLLTALDGFDVSTNHKFISYARWYIKAEMNVYLNKHYRTIRLPTHHIREISSGKKEKEDYASTVSAELLEPDVYVNAGSVPPVEYDFASARRKKVELVFRGVKSIQAEVIQRKLGLYGEPESYEAIGNEKGLTRERIRQIYEAGMAKLRRKYTKEELIKLLM